MSVDQDAVCFNGQGKRRQSVNIFSLNAQRLAAGRQHPQQRASAYHCLGDQGRSLDDVFAAVQHQQHRLITDHSGDGLRRNFFACRGQTELRSDSPGGVVGVCRRRQFSYVHAAWEFACQSPRHLKGQLCFADAARPRQRHDALRAQQLQQISDRTFAPKQLAGSGGQVADRCLGQRWFRTLHNAGQTGELVATPGDGKDQLALRSEGSAQCGDLSLKAVFFNNAPGPCASQQFVFRDRHAWGFKQGHQQVKASAAQRHSLPFT